MEIWFNPKCSKCRAARTAAEDSGQPHELRMYLETPPTADELDDVLRRLGKEPWEICRMKEPVAAELGLASMKTEPSERAAWIALMVKHPVLIERPIVVRDDGRAVVARTDETIAEALRR